MPNRMVSAIEAIAFVRSVLTKAMSRMGLGLKKDFDLPMRYVFTYRDDYRNISNRFLMMAR